jgi:hypothetical protein
LETVFKDAATVATEKAQLQREKKQAETEATNKEKELNDEKEAHNKTRLEVANKLTSDLVEGLDKLVKTGIKKPKKNPDGTDLKDSSGNIVYEELIDTSKIAAIKKVVDELKTQGITTDFSSLNSKFTDLKKDLKEVKPTRQTNY